MPFLEKISAGKAAAKDGLASFFSAVIVDGPWAKYSSHNLVVLPVAQ